jgi:hypothetical protein
MSEGNSIRVSRGGSWDVGPQYARVVVRGSGDPGDPGDRGLGVRLVEEDGPTPDPRGVPTPTPPPPEVPE